MEEDRIKWNRRFASEDSFLGERPSPFLRQEIERIKRLAPGMTALDIACGEGRNSVFLAQHGFLVTALDISDVGIAKGRRRAEEAGVRVDFRQVDLDGYHIAESFDLIINFNFLLRALIPEEVAALVPGGLLLFDTILESPQLLATHKPDYLLRHGELVRIFAAYDGEILFAEEDEVEEQDQGQGNMPTTRLFFRKAGS
ncbi:MAG: class I SAM-dependent methyltransferase [Deltaproteobacteria bacterium]|nr:class I SAM-dependent methyltransferase [Deltaproteobacteria bacterium]